MVGAFLFPFFVFAFVVGAICHFVGREKPLNGATAAALAGFVMGAVLILPIAPGAAAALGIVLSIVTVASWGVAYLADTIGVLLLRWAHARAWRQGVLAMLACVPVAGVLAHEVTYPQRVLDSAVAQAAGAPVCIALPRLKRQAQSWADLSFWSLPNGLWQPHAVAVVDRGGGKLDAYHWSFWQAKFVYDERYARAHIYMCRPRRDYARTLPIFAAPKDDIVEIFFAGRFLAVPADFAPRYSPDHLFIETVGPKFLPLGRFSQRSASMSNLKGGLIEKYAYASAALHLRPYKHEYGMSVVKYPYGKQLESEFRFAKDGHGVVDVIVECSEPDMCRMTFKHDAAAFWFWFPADEMPRWKEMREAFIAKFDSFVVEGRRFGPVREPAAPT